MVSAARPEATAESAAGRRVGILALQGGFASHGTVFESLGAAVREVRSEADLGGCDALVIPGGESTVLTRLLMEPGTGPAFGKPWEPSPLWHALRRFGDPDGPSPKPVMGTCAGLIMLARPCGDERVVSLGLLPATVERNAYGRQNESFVEGIELREGSPGEAGRKPFRAVFIRAPRIRGLGDGVEVLASARGHGLEEPVMVRYRNILGLTFHPELEPEDPRIHRYFLGMGQNS